MHVLIDDTFATQTSAVPIRSHWIAPPGGIAVEMIDCSTTRSSLLDCAFLAPSSELFRLQQTHVVHGNVAVVADGVGAIAMRTPVRPDEVEATPVRLLGASGTAELLARATLKPFYGIEPTSWLHDPDAPDVARAKVVIVEGAEALREAEGGFSEDLSRAWFILTAQPVVSHVLLVPRELPTDLLDDVLAFFDGARTAGLAKRREWRSELADREGVSRDRANAFWAAQRLKLEESDRRALLDLLYKGSRGTNSAPPKNVEFVDGVGAE